MRTRVDNLRRPRSGGSCALLGLTLLLTLGCHMFEARVQRVRRAGLKPDAQLLYGIGVACWGNSYGDPSLDPVTRVNVVDMGLDAIKQSIDLAPECFDAMAYDNLLFRDQAKVATTFAEAERWNADAWLKKALDLREKQQEGAVDTGASESS